MHSHFFADVTYDISPAIIKLILLFAMFAVLALAGIIRKFFPGRDRAIAFGLLATGVVSLLPILLTCWHVIDGFGSEYGPIMAVSGIAGAGFLLGGLFLLRAESRRRRMGVMDLNSGRPSR